MTNFHGDVYLNELSYFKEIDLFNENHRLIGH